MNRAPLRSSVIILVLVTLLFTAAALTAFVEKAGNDLLVEVRQSDAKRLRQEALSALEVTLAVLEDFRLADNGLHSAGEGWGDPLGWAGWTPSGGRTVEVSFEDESGKIPLSHADTATLARLFGSWQMAPPDAAKLADAIAGWMQGGYIYSTAITPDYRDAPVPYAEPGRPMRSFGELAAVVYARDVFFDENGLPDADYWRFVNDVSIFNYPQPDANGANADVLAAVGQYTDEQRQHVGDFLSARGQYAQQGPHWFGNGGTLSAVAGAGAGGTLFGTTITALRIKVTVHDGSSLYRLSAVVAPQGGATANTTNATNATAVKAGTSPTAKAPVAAAPQPAPANAAAASQSINYPFTLLEILEDDDIPQPPPAPPPT